MKLQGNVDRVTRSILSGWVIDEDDHDKTLIVMLIEGREILACAIANQYRSDIDRLFGGGMAGFSFDLTTVRSKSGECQLSVLPLGDISIDRATPLRPVSITSARARSLERWKGSESAKDLTFGMILDAADFFSFVDRKNLGRVAEIGPGYGRLFSQLLDGKRSFDTFVGYDISSSRVLELTARFGGSKVVFKLVNVLEDRLDEFDTLFCSSTVEHFYPDCRPALLNISKSMSPGGRIYVDFPSFGDDPNFRSATFSPEGGEFVRFYSKAEVAEAMRFSGLDLLRYEPFAMGSTSEPLGVPSEHEACFVLRNGRAIGVRRFMAVAQHQ